MVYKQGVSGRKSTLYKDKDVGDDGKACTILPKGLVSLRSLRYLFVSSHALPFPPSLIAVILNII